MSTLQSILGYATRLDRIETHPSKGARKLAGTKNRRLSVPEIVKLALAMRHAALKETEGPIALPIVRLLLLTGFRISEGQNLEREWVSAAEGYVGFPDTEGDAQVRAIGTSAAPRLLSIRSGGRSCWSQATSPAEVKNAFIVSLSPGRFPVLRSCGKPERWNEEGMR